MKLDGTYLIFKGGSHYFSSVKVIGAGDVERFGKINRGEQFLSICQYDITIGVVMINIRDVRRLIGGEDMLVAFRQGLDNALISVDGVFFCQ